MAFTVEGDREEVSHLAVIVFVSDGSDSLPDAHHDLVGLLVLRRAGRPTAQLADFL